MLEIDGVRRSIEMGGNFGLVDQISDDYYDVIKWVTDSAIDGIYQRAVRRRLEFFDQHHAYIRRLLNHSEDIYPGVTAAYENTLEQVRTLAAL